jgi:bifunctional non-homologous end joining protein LigD
MSDIMARPIQPMLATKVDKPPNGAQWSFELKFDGIRAFVIIEDGALTIQSRNGTNMTSWSELAAITGLVAANSAVMDGEIILGNGSVESFNTLLKRVRSRGRTPGAEPATFVVFDLLEVDGVEIVDLPLDERRDRLRAITKLGDRHLVMARFFNDGPGLYEAAIEHGLEGIVGKKRSSKYEPGRSRSWLKVKIPGAAERHEWTGTERQTG